MPLGEKERDHLQIVLRKCDMALADKPTLASIFGRKWRTDFAVRVLSVHSLADAVFPEAYHAPCLTDMPADYQQRLEEGAAILRARLRGQAWAQFVSRIRDRDAASATEELLLARGFATEFGDIGLPSGNPAAPRPEFTVSIGTHRVAIEARGLRNSRRVQQLNDRSWRSGQYYWISADPSIGNPGRVRKALAEKMLESADDFPRISVLTLYSAFDALAAFDLARQMALRPASFNIPQEKYPLAVALASHRLLQGIWFNDCVVQRIRYSRKIKERIRSAIKLSLYPRTDGVFLHEGMSDDEHNSAVWGKDIGETEG